MKTQINTDLARPAGRVTAFICVNLCPSVVKKAGDDSGGESRDLTAKNMFKIIKKKFDPHLPLCEVVHAHGKTTTH